MYLFVSRSGILASLKTTGINPMCLRQQNLRLQVAFIIFLLATECAATAQEAPGSKAAIQQAKRAAALKTPDCGMPIYSIAAMRQQARGKVSMSFLVGTDGHVHDVTVSQSSGYRELDDSAFKSLRRCVYEPAMVEGIPVEERLSIDYIYSPATKP